MFDKIRNQLIAGFLIAAIVPLLMMGFSNHLTTSSTLKAGLLVQFNHSVDLQKDRIESFLSGIRNDLFIMKDSHLLHDILSASTSSSGSLMKMLEEEFLVISKIKKYYHQIRYIDENGMEVVRIDSDGEKSTIVPASELQNKAGRYYFLEAVKLDPNQIYISPLDLNMERGKIEIPYKPVIHYAIPVFHNGKKRGILILNVSAKTFLDPIKALNSEDDHFMLFSDEGYYFSHPNPAREWGSPADLGTLKNAADDFSGEVLSLLTSSGEKGVEDGEKFIAQRTIFPDNNNRDIYWKLVRISSKGNVLAPLHRLTYIFVVLVIFGMLAALLIAIVISKGITAPIINLTKAADAVSDGDIDTPIEVAGSTEIRTLAMTISKLKDSLKIAMKHLME